MRIEEFEYSQDDKFNIKHTKSTCIKENMNYIRNNDLQSKLF